MMWNGACPFWNAGAFGAWGWAGLVLNLLFWVALIAGTVYLITWIVRRAGNSAPGIVSGSGPAAAIRIAQERYARGEISREEYLNLVADLQ